MTRNIINPEEGAELKRLYIEHATATSYAVAVLRDMGMNSPEFRAADEAVTKLWPRIRQILGNSDHPWTA